ncbi:hypothetical protein M405DRAFT_809906 [Rhizopogon salebrosus TDB-379]|nr:hypothetical protein M405DRAFT_809906 [Rhizopogon salebrosus TDB-379]
MQLALYSRYWFTFLSSIAFLETPTDVFRFARTTHTRSITLPTEGLRHSSSSAKIS